MIATPVPTHYPLAKQALEAGKHVFVEKPPAMHAAEIDELVALAPRARSVLMPGHLLLYHPGVRKLKELIDAGELGEVLCVYGNRQNLGMVRTDENALWSLGVHDLSVILYLLDEEPARRSRTATRSSPGVEDVVFCYLEFPSGKIAHMHLSWLDPHKMRKITVVGREKMVGVRRHGARAQDHRLREGARGAAESYGEWRTRTGDIFSPEDLGRRAAEARVPDFLRSSPTAGTGWRCEDGSRVVRALERYRSLHGLKSIRRAVVYGDDPRRRRPGARERGRRQAAGARPEVDREARAAAADGDR